MSRNQYRHTMDELIGHPIYSNAIGATFQKNVMSGSFPATQPSRTSSANQFTQILANSNANKQTVSPISANTVTRPATVNKGAYVSSQSATVDTTLVPDSSIHEPIGKTPVVTPVAPIVAPVVSPIVALAPINPSPMGGGGGGGGASEDKTADNAVPELPKKSFLKQNLIPIVLLGVSIFIFIKKPLK